MAKNQREINTAELLKQLDPKDFKPISHKEFNAMIKRLLNSPPRTYKQIVEDNREERKRLGIKRFTPKMMRMSQEELLKYIEQRNLKNAKKVKKTK